MILSFKKQFIEPILSGSKIHTIREDKNNRWKSGRSIQFADGVRTKLYNEFKSGTCFRTQEIEFKWKKHNAGLVSESWGVQVFIDGRNVTNETDIVDRLIIGDGFKDRKEFFEWDAWNKKNFKGKLIHWTDTEY
jgi:hypothetical protein